MDNKRIAVFPGTFDPFTLGHKNIVERALKMFDKVIIAIGINCNKKPLFPLNERISTIRGYYADEKNVQVESYEGLTVDFCKKNSASFIIRGLRSSNDFLFERDIAHANAQLTPEIETIFLVTPPELSYISSSMVREVYINGGDYKQFLP